MPKDMKVPVVDEPTLTEGNPCSGGVCRERLCGRMKQELRFLSFLADEDLEEVAGYFECRQAPSGATLWAEGDAGDFIAFIMSGRIEINKRTEFGGKPIVLGILSRGSFLGERSVLEGAPRSESAIVIDHADMILLTRRSFQRLLSERPTLGVKLLEGMLLTVSRRLRRSYERLTAIF